MNFQIFKTIYMRLKNPSDNLIIALANNGITVRDIEGRERDFLIIMMEIDVALRDKKERMNRGNGNAKREYIELAQQIGGLRNTMDVINFFSSDWNSIYFW